MTDAAEILPMVQPVDPPWRPSPMGMVERAVESGASIEVLTKLMDLQERHERNQARRAFDAAMADAKAEIPPIIKNREVDYAHADNKGRTNYRYEDLAEIARTIDPILARHGLSYRFRTTSEANSPIVVTCIISHRDGHFEENTLSGGRDDSGKKNALQSIASAITFLSRYALKAALGLAASNDDDGRASGDAEPSGTISDEQFTALQALVDEAGADTEKMCRYFKVDALRELPTARYADAVASLRKKIAAKGPPQ